jgi:exopolysaccharide production protein ExoQ
VIDHIGLTTPDLEALSGQLDAKSVDVGTAKTSSGVEKASWFDVIFFYFGVLTYTQVIATPFRIFINSAPVAPGESNPMLFSCQALLLVTLAFIFIVRRERLLPFLRFARPFLVLAGLCIMSTLWSSFPDLTLRRSITLSMSGLFGVYCYATFGISRFGGMIEALAIVLGILSTILYIARPDVGVDPTIDDYTAMCGIFDHKNQLAAYMTVAIGCAAYRLIEGRQIVTFVPSFFFMMFCLWLSHSASSAVISLVVSALAMSLMLSKTPRLRVFYIYCCFSAVAILAAIVALAPELLFTLLGRDSSFTGRVPLWEAVLDAIADRPIFGYGYAGFWNAASPTIQYIWLLVQWNPPSAHSGYLDITLDLGLVGLGLLTYIFVSNTLGALRARRFGRLSGATWVLLFMITIICTNFDESSLSDLSAVLLTLAMVEVGVWKERWEQTIPSARRIRGKARRTLIIPTEPRVRTDLHRPVDGF